MYSHNFSNLNNYFYVKRVLNILKNWLEYKSSTTSFCVLPNEIE